MSPLFFPYPLRKLLKHRGWILANIWRWKGPKKDGPESKKLEESS
jgi:hypothetical protein